MSVVEREPCPACGGAGGGPFGRAHAGWDIETYECPACEGSGVMKSGESARTSRPGIVKTSDKSQTSEKPAKRSTGG